ncbi:MAG: methyl-accepting chemotaxis protein [bacterium]|nr:methyl-accepting chemotaxis protein [bacterium]
MKIIQRNITIIIWICSIVIGIFSVMSGFSGNVGKFVGIAVFSTSALSTVLYFLPISDRVKAVGVLLVIGLATLVTSVALGGNAGTFVTSFLVLGVAILYFDPIILAAYTVIYLIICIITLLINNVYIVGRTMESYMGGILIITYAIMAGCLGMATMFGKRYMTDALADEAEAQKTAEIIEAQSDAAHKISISLSENLNAGDEEVKQLFREASQVNANIETLTTSETETMATFRQLNERIVNSTKWIEKNYELISTLTDNYNVALENVRESKKYSNNAEHSMADIASTIQHAHQCIVVSSEETGKISNIIKDINEIASQTNLLAINASIEAARVGDKGTGFDIVAEQIRTLSVQSKQASENINRILASLTEALNSTLEKVCNGKNAIDHGVSNLGHMVKCVEQIDYYSNQSQVTLSKEVEAFEQIKKQFGNMVDEVEKSMKAAETNKTELEEVEESTKSQANSTKQVLEHLKEMQELTAQIMKHFTVS